MQNPAPGAQSLGPPQTTATKIQNHNEGDQNTPSQDAPKRRWNGIISCNKCSFTCNSFRSIRIHFRNEHRRKKPDPKKLKAIKKAAKRARRWEAGKQQGNPAQNFQSGIMSHSEEQGLPGKAVPKFQVIDKRQMALNYSEKFKITSREEATIVLKLTQQLSNQLEQYFEKKLDALNSSIPESSSTISKPAPINSPSVTYENLHPTSSANQGLKTELQWRTEGPSFSMSASVCSFDHMPLKDPRAEKRRADASHQLDVLPECSSTSEFQRRKKRPHKECDDSPTMHLSSSSYMNAMGSSQHGSAKEASRSSSTVATYTNLNNLKEKSHVPEMFGGEMHMVTDTPHTSQNSLNDNISRIEAVEENKSLKGTFTADTSEVGTAKSTAVSGPSSLDSNCPSEASTERPSSSHTQGKTSKTLSPDILHLLKGKDVNTVTNILRTLSPFYPALQEVNIEILAQVLVNTGALD